MPIQISPSRAYEASIDRWYPVPSCSICRDDLDYDSWLYGDGDETGSFFLS